PRSPAARLGRGCATPAVCQRRASFTSPRRSCPTIALHGTSSYTPLARGPVPLKREALCIERDDGALPNGRTEVATMWTRRTFLEALSTGSLATRHVTLPRPPLLNRRDATQQSPGSPRAEMMREGEIVIERPLAGRPHAGKVLAAIQPHSDDLP